MTKDEFDNTKWRKGMQVTVIGEPLGRYEVVEVDFGKETVGIYVDGYYSPMSYDEVEVVKE